MDRNGPAEYWAKIRAENAANIALQSPQPGWYGQLNSHFGDVWCHIQEVFPPSDTSQGSCMLWRDAEKRYEYTFFADLRRVCETPPPGDRVYGPPKRNEDDG